MPSHGRFIALGCPHIRGVTVPAKERTVLLRMRLLTEMKTGDDETTRTFRPLAGPELAVKFVSRSQEVLG